MEKFKELSIEEIQKVEGGWFVIVGIFAVCGTYGVFAK